MALSGSAVLDKQWVCEVIRRLRAERGEDTHVNIQVLCRVR